MDDIPEIKIIHNRIKCNWCGDIIESHTVHECVTCACGKCSVDGGHEYLKQSCEKKSDYTEMSEVK